MNSYTQVIAFEPVNANAPPQELARTSAAQATFLSASEIMSINKLVMSVASDRNMSVKLVRTLLLRKMAADQVNEIQKKDFENAILFLADLVSMD